MSETWTGASLKIGERFYRAKHVGFRQCQIWRIGEVMEGGGLCGAGELAEGKLVEAIGAACDLLAEGDGWRDHLAAHKITIARDREVGGYRVEHANGVEFLGEGGRLFRDGRSFSAAVAADL